MEMLKKNKKQGGWTDEIEEKEKLERQKQDWLNKKEEERRGSAKDRHWTEETKTRRCWTRIVWRSREVTKQKAEIHIHTGQPDTPNQANIPPAPYLTYLSFSKGINAALNLSVYEKLYYEVYYTQLQLTGILCAQCRGS